VPTPEPDGLPETVEDALARIAAAPGDAELHQRLGLLYTRAGRYTEAWAAYQRSFDLDPRDAWTHLYIGNWFYTLDRCHEALRWFESAAALMPDQPIVYTCQGDVYKTLRRYGLAEKMYRTAVRVAPDDEHAQRKLARWRAFRVAGQG
jgi:tetratricopeptide (TPR) repeat protein